MTHILPLIFLINELFLILHQTLNQINLSLAALQGYMPFFISFKATNTSLNVYTHCPLTHALDLYVGLKF